MAKRRIDKEKETVELMIRLYCRHKEKNAVLCNTCQDLLLYSFQRLEHCPFGEEKTTCQHCKIHCYNPHKRELMRKVMKYSGPRVILFHPKAAIRHILHSRKRDKKTGKE